MIRKFTYLLIFFCFLLGACSPSIQPTMILPTVLDDDESNDILEITPYPTRPAYAPGELVDYVAQTGDTLPALAVRFNTTVNEIREANSFIPDDATTMPPGMPMKIPIYYRTLWGTPFHYA
jgi:LasA protease